MDAEFAVLNAWSQTATDVDRDAVYAVLFAAPSVADVHRAGNALHQRPDPPPRSDRRSPRRLCDLPTAQPPPYVVGLLLPACVRESPDEELQTGIGPLHVLLRLREAMGASGGRRRP